MARARGGARPHVLPRRPSLSFPPASKFLSSWQPRAQALVSAYRPILQMSFGGISPAINVTMLAAGATSGGPASLVPGLTFTARARPPSWPPQRSLSSRPGFPTDADRSSSSSCSSTSSSSPAFARR